MGKKKTGGRRRKREKVSVGEVGERGSGEKSGRRVSGER